MKKKPHFLADFSILTKITVSGPYRRGHFVSWFFWLSFPNVENTLRILLKHSKFCSFIKTISLKQKQHVLRTFQFWPKSLYPDITGVAILLVDFFGWVFQMLKIPFEFFWNIQNFVLSSKQSVWSKNSMFCGLFNFDENRCIRTLPAWPFCWLIFLVEFFKCWKYPSNSSETFKILFFHQNNQFEAKTACFADFSILTKIAVSGPYRRGHFFGWFFVEFFNVENTLPILLKHSKCCSFIKTISLKQKQHVLRTFQFWPKSLYPDLTGVAILLFVDFFGWVFQMLKIPFEFFWNIQNFVLSSKQSVWSKNSMFCGLFNFDQNRCIRTLPAWWPFCSSETLKILFFHQKNQFEAKTAFLRNFQFSPKLLYTDLTGVFLVDFLKCWKYPSNSSETFKILFFHQNNQFEAKTACFADFSILTKIAVSGPYRRGHFVGWFFWLSFSNVENTLPILLKHSKFCSFIKTISLKQKQHVLRTFQFWPKSLYPDITGVAILLVDFFGWVFQMLKIPFQFFWNIQNFVLSSKQSVWSKNSMFCGLFNFDQNCCIRTLPAWPFCWFDFFGWFFWLIFGNVENTLLILLKHSKFCSFIKTISLKQKQHVLRTFQFWPKSLYPDLTGVAILLVDFFGWVFQMLKIPSEFFWNIQNFVLSSKQSVWSKNSMFWGLFNFDENRCIRTLPAWPFCWLIYLVEFFKCWKYPSNSSETFKMLFFSSKQSVWSKNSMFCGLFNFDQNRCIRTLPAWAIWLVDFFGWVFQMLKIPFEFFWNIQNFVLSSKQSVWSKNSMFCGLFNFDQNRCIRTLPAWPFCWLIFFVEFFKCWKYPSNSSETFKILFFHQNNQFEAKTACFADFSILTKIAVSGPYRRGHFVGWFFGWVFQMLKIPFEFFWNIQNFVLSSKQSVWSKNSMFCGLFNFDQNRCIRTLPAWPFCWLIFLVEFFKCWKYPSNSSETFKILFFHQNNQFEAKTACFADFSILTKIAVSGPYRRGHFVGWFFFSNGWIFETFKMLFFQMLKIPFWITGLAEKCWKYPSIQNFVLSSKQSVWSKNSMFCGLFNFDQNRCIRTLPAWPFFWLIFWNVENTLPILLKHSKCCSFIKTISLKQKQHVLRTFQFWPKSLYPDITGVAILLVDFFGWVFQMLKIPFEFFWNIQNFVLSSKQSVWSKNSMFCGLFNFDQNRCIRTLPAWPFCWLIFLVEFFKCWKYPSNSSETLKMFSFIKTISLKQKQHVLRTFQFWPKSLYPDLTGVAIFLVDFLKCWKYPSNSSETFKILFFHQNNQFEAKTACFADFSIVDQNRCIRTLPAKTACGHFIWLIFLVDFLKCWKYPSNSSETFKMLFFHQNNQFEAKTACFADFSILTKITVSGPYRRGHFVGWFFWLSFSNVENTLRILLKHSKFCSFIKTISLKQKQHVLRTFQFWPKSLYPDLTGVAILFWVCFFIKTISFKQKQHVLLIFLVDFLKCWKYPSNSSETFKILFFHQNNQFEAKTACFADFSILTKIAVSGPYRRGHFFGWFFWLSFSNVENTLRILLKHSKFCSFIKTISLKQKQHVLRTFQFWRKSLYPDLTGVANFFWLIFWNVENTLPILLKHSKCCSFIKTISLKQKQHVLRTFQFWPKSLYPDLTGVSHFLGWFFWLSFSNVENTLRILLKHSKFCSFIKTISLKQKQHVLRTFQFWPKSLYPDLTGVAIFLVDFLKCWKYPSNSSETFKILFFHQNNQFEAKTACFADFSILTKIAVSGHYRRGHFVGFFFFGWVFQMLKIPFEFFWNIQNFVLSSKQSVWSKNSMFCGLFNFDQNRCIRTLPAWPFCWLIFLVEFFKCWKYPSNSSETFKILFFHQNNQFEAKTACFADFSILTKIAVSGPYRRGHFVGWFFWLIFSNVENTLRIFLKHSRCCSFIKTISLKRKQQVLRNLKFSPKLLYTDLYRLGYFFGWFFEMLKIPFQFFWNIQNFVLWWIESVWRKNCMFCGLFNFDEYRCIRTLPAWPFCWLIFLVEFFKCWKYPSNFSEIFKIVVLSSKQSVCSKSRMFSMTFQFWPKFAVSGHYRRGHFVGWFFWLSFSNVEYTLLIILKHWKCCSLIKRISLKQKQHVLRNFQFSPKLLYTDIAGVAILLVDFFSLVFQILKIPFQFFWNIQNFVLSSKQSVWRKNSMFCGLFNFDENRCIRTLPAWPFCWQMLFRWVFQMLKIPFQFFWNIENVVLSSKEPVWSKNSLFCGIFNF